MLFLRPSPSVPFFCYECTDSDNDPCLLIPIWLCGRQAIIPYGAIGYADVIFCEVVIYRGHGAEIIMLFPLLQVDDLSLL